MYVDIDIVRPYLIEERHTPLSKKIFSTDKKFLTSVVTIIQLMADLYTAKKDPKKLDELEKIELEIVPLDEEIMKTAIEIVKNHKFSTHDAIHAATSIKLKQKYLSFKQELDKVKGVEREDPYIFVSDTNRPGFDKKFRFLKF